MPPRPFVRALKVITLAATLWITYLLPWPGPAWVAATKPAVTAAAFAALSWRLGVGSWPLTIAFCLTFFPFGVIETHAVSFAPGTDLAGAPSDTRLWTLYLWAMLFSPISLWAPVVFGTLTYTLVTRFRSNNRWCDRS
jgi:hypothetical protein